MDYCRENIFNYWSCCPSINLSNYITKNELEEALSGISGCDLTEIEETIDSMQDEIEENAANLEALQGIISSLADRVSTLENLVAKKANISDLEDTEEALAQAINILRQEMSNKADASAITEIWDAIEAISGDTPTPDTGETTTKKLIVTVLNKDNYELDCDSDSNLDTTLTKPNNDYLSYLTAEVGDCITEIDNSAFSGCFKMNRIVLPSTITVIHNHALSVDFYGEPVTHVDIYLYATVPPTLSQDGESGGYYFSQDFTLYVPSASVEAYKTAWPQYADNIEIMS